MLFWHKHDLQQAVNDLANFTPFPEEWSLEDKALFEQAFQFHGKNFHRIRQMVYYLQLGLGVAHYFKNFLLLLSKKNCSLLLLTISKRSSWSREKKYFCLCNGN